MDDKGKKARPRAGISCTFGPTEDTPRSASVTSLSERGCFVKTKAHVAKGQRLHLKLWLPEWRWLPLSCEVIYHLEQVGFGVGFCQLTPEQEQAIRRTIEAAERATRSHEPDDAEED